MSYPCQAEDSDGDECDCEAFAPKATQPKLCRRCMHLKKHHPQTDETVSSILLKVKEEHGEEPGAAMFSKLTQAKRESLDGMRPKRPVKLTSKDLTITLPKPIAVSKRGAKTATREPPSVGSFKVDAIVVLPDGTQSNGKRLELIDDGIPSKAFHQVLINQGLAVRKDNQIDIPKAATHQELVDILSDHLPGPMAFFDMLGPIVINDPSSGAEVMSVPGWVLLTRVRQRLEIVEVAHPTGNDVFVHRGQKKATENRIIFLSSRRPIPRNERESWRTTESLAFAMPKSLSGSEDEGKEAPKTRRKKSNKKRPSSVAFEDSASDEWLHPGEEPIGTQPALKRRNMRAHTNDLGLPSIYTDHIAEEINAPINENVAPYMSNAVAGPSNAVAGPSNSRSVEPIDLTGSRSPSPYSIWSNYNNFDRPSASYHQAPFTPERAPASETLPDPAYSDPVEYTYATGPSTTHKFF